MTMKTSDLLLYKERALAQVAIAYAKNHGATRQDEMEACITETYRLCRQYNLDPCICIARQCDETGGPNGTVYCSPIWTTRLNCGGLGVTDGNDEMMGFANGLESARAFVAHMVTYAQVEFSEGELTPADDPRFEATIKAGTNGTCATLNDLEGKWFTNPQGAENSAARGNAVYPNIPNQTGSTVSSFTTNVPGIPGGPLVTDYPIKFNMVPPSMTNNRPGIPARQPRRSVQHGNGNPNSTAESEAQYLRNGAEGRQASYHVTGDDKEIWMMIPANEVTWQAADGGGPGNMNGFSCEMVEDADIWADPYRRDKVIHVCADFMGRCAARLNIAVPEQHWDFNWVVCGCTSPCETQCGDRHNCPDKLRHTTINGRPAWDLYAARWKASKADELARMGGQTTTPAPPQYAERRTPPKWDGSDKEAYGETWQAVRRQVKTIKNTHRLQVFDTNGPRVGPDIARGTSFMISWYVKTNDKGNYLVNDLGTVVGAGNVTPMISIRGRT